jgi:hypothetical protein
MAEHQDQCAAKFRQKTSAIKQTATDIIYELNEAPFILLGRIEFLVVDDRASPFERLANICDLCKCYHAQRERLRDELAALLQQSASPH